MVENITKAEAAMKKNNIPATSNVVDNIKKMEAKRAERRKALEEQK